MHHLHDGYMTCLEFVKVHIFWTAKTIAPFFLQDGNKPHSEDSIETSSVVGNPTAQTSTQLDSDIQNSNTGKRTSATQLKTEVETTKDNSSNKLIERKSDSSTEASKQLTDTNQVPRSKGIILPATTEEVCPHTSSISEAEHASHTSKDASKSKTASSETMPRNSPTLEQLSSAHKPETQVWINVYDSVLFESAEITNKMQPCNRIYCSKIYWRLNMFRVAHRSSSGAPNCICSLWFICPCGDGEKKFPHSALVTAGHHMDI